MKKLLIIMLLGSLAACSSNPNCGSTSALRKLQERSLEYNLLLDDEYASNLEDMLTEIEAGNYEDSMGTKYEKRWSDYKKNNTFSYKFSNIRTTSIDKDTGAQLCQADVKLDSKETMIVYSVEKTKDNGLYVQLVDMPMSAEDLDPLEMLRMNNYLYGDE